MVRKKDKSTCKLFPEYWHLNYPELTLEECKSKAKWYKKSCNYQCIEYYEKKYPNLSYEDHLNGQSHI